jgi:hypothetical protein
MSVRLVVYSATDLRKLIYQFIAALKGLVLHPPLPLPLLYHAAGPLSNQEPIRPSPWTRYFPLQQLLPVVSSSAFHVERENIG